MERETLGFRKGRNFGGMRMVVIRVIVSSSREKKKKIGCRGKCVNFKVFVIS